MLEKAMGIHSKEVYKHNNKKSLADKYADAKEIDWGMCANNYIIDANKRGKTQDITNGKFKLNEPKAND